MQGNNIPTLFVALPTFKLDVAVPLLGRKSLPKKCEPAQKKQAKKMLKIKIESESNLKLFLSTNIQQERIWERKIRPSSKNPVLLNSYNAGTHETMLLCWRSFKRETSLNVVPGMPSPSPSIVVFLMATILLSTRLRDLYTTP